MKRSSVRDQGGELEEGKGMEGNDPGEERSIPDAGERQASLLSSKAIGYINGFVKNMEDGAFFLKENQKCKKTVEFRHMIVPL